MGKTEQQVWISTPTFTQSVKFFMIGVIFIVPGALILFAIILTDFRLMREIVFSFPIIVVDLIAILFFCIGIVLLLFSVLSFKRVMRWETAGQIVNGVIQEGWVEKQFSARYGSYARYHVKYRFRVMEKTYIMQQEVSEKEYSSLSKGQVVTVKYLPTMPHIARFVK